MKKIIPIIYTAIFILSSCSQNTRVSENNNAKADAVTLQNKEKLLSQSLFATMQIKDSIREGELIMLKFTVYNHTDSTQQFCKWQTPFEPLMSKYLEVKQKNSEEAAYHGPMARRIMPPPADSYIKVNPGDSLSIDVDLLKAYTITKPAKYTIKFIGHDINGLVVKDSVAFVYAMP